jgi:hypothetical protein
VAGIGEKGVVTTIITWAIRDGDAHCSLHIGGLISPVREHVSWVRDRIIAPGDIVQVTVLDSTTADEPITRSTQDQDKDLEARKEHVRKLAQDLGWKVQES